MDKKPQKLKMDCEFQERSKLWWNQNPMSYDWHKTIASSEGTLEFFQQVDARFFNSSPFYRGDRPFARLIPFDKLRGKRVLEIGCGIGFHAQLLSEAGCSLTAIDLTPRAVELTRMRLSLKGIPADIRLMDAEHMEFENGEFDFVWSWGVIHHSANPEQIVKEAYRVLKSYGEFRLMVYHRQSLSAYITMARGILSGKAFQGMSLSDILSFYSDGHGARFYTRSELAKILLSCRFSTVDTYVLGEKSELIPLPGKGLTRHLKSAILSKISDTWAERILAAIGGFLFGIAVKRPNGWWIG